MADKPFHNARTWSFRRKLLVGGITAVIVIALALGLGLGLTLGKDDGDGNGDNNMPSLTPLPNPNQTLPWTPKVNDTWQIILSHTLSLSSRDTVTTPNVSIFDIDLFDTPTDTIKQLQALGKKVICYFSAGSYENWRPDAQEFKAEDLGKELDGWPGEKWLKLSNPNVRSIMAKRIRLASEKGCNGVDPDNVDGYQNDNGLSLTKNDSIQFMKYLSSIARPMNIALGLKNAGDIVSTVLPVVDFSVNEQCLQYNECATFIPFINEGKPVLHIEYPAGSGEVAANGFGEETRRKFCSGNGNAGDRSGVENFSTVLKKMDLDGWVEFCDGTIAESNVINATRWNNKGKND